MMKNDNAHKYDMRVAYLLGRKAHTLGHDPDVDNPYSVDGTLLFVDKDAFNAWRRGWNDAEKSVLGNGRMSAIWVAD
jgi:hypothetical protein